MNFASAAPRTPVDGLAGSGRSCDKRTIVRPADRALNREGRTTDAAVELRVPPTGDARRGARAARQHGEDAKVLAGGQSLIPHDEAAVRLAGAPDRRQPRPRARRHRASATASLRIGALVRHNAAGGLRRHGARYPTIAAAAPQIADPLVRNLGTIGGSLAHADPAGDWGSVMLALGAERGAAELRGRARDPDRRLPASTRSPPSLAAERDGDRGPRPGAGRPRRRHLPEAGAQGGRLRHGRRSPCTSSWTNGYDRRRPASA